MIRNYIDAYFERPDPVTQQFLHKATVITDLSQGRLDELLLKAICASGLRSLSPGNRDTTANLWMREVQGTLMASIGGQSITQLQTLMLFIRHRYETGVIRDVWMLLPTAARIAFTKRLNYEHPNMDPIQQESLRRIMWSIFNLDRILCGGLEDLVVCPPERIHIRLPSRNNIFERGLPSKAPYLAAHESDDLSEMDASSYAIRLSLIREKVLR